MAITKKQAELIGIFKGLPYTDNYFSSKFKNKHFTIAETVKLDEVANDLAEMSIIPRNTALPILDAKGFRRVAITPDILGNKSTLTATELLEIQAGQSETATEAQDNFNTIRDRHLIKLKNAYEISKERLATEIYLKGKVTLPISKDVIDLGYEEKISKDFKKSTDDWGVFILGLVSEYQKLNGIYPNLIEVSMDIFQEMLKDETLRNQAQVYNTNQLGVLSNTNIPAFVIYGYTVIALPNAIGVDGKAITTEKLAILSNNETFTSIYTGIPYSNGNKLSMFKGEYLIDEIIEKDPARQYFTFQSGYCPIIALPKRVVRYEITVKAK